MENKCKRFLSLLLALVMVIALMPVGHANAETAELTPVVPVDGGTYVMCFKNGEEYHALTSEATTFGGKNCKRTETITADTTVADKHIWKLVAGNGGYMLQDANGKFLSLCGTINNSAALEDAGEPMSLIRDGDGYLVKNPSGRYINALGGLGSEHFGNAFGNYSVGTTVYFFAVEGYNSKAGWIVGDVNSQYVNANNANEGAFSMAFDNNSDTRWHAEYSSRQDKIPTMGNATEDSLVVYGEIDLGKECTINRFSFRPRMDQDNSGRVTKDTLKVKEADDTAWKVVAENVGFSSDRGIKTFAFPAQPVRYVRFEAEEANDGWATVSEFDIDNVVSLNAKRSDGTVVALTECEYTYTAAGKLVHDNIYVTLGGNSGKIPHSDTNGSTATYEAGNNLYRLKLVDEKERYLHFYSDNVDNFGWDRCGDDRKNNSNNDSGNVGTHSTGTHNGYLFKAVEEFDPHSLIPGYTQVTSLEEGGKYLIVGGHRNGNYYVMYPTTSGTAEDHSAQLVTAHVHSWVDATCTTPKTCSVCAATEGEENPDNT